MQSGPHRKPHPTFNHVAISVPPDLLDEAGRSDLLAFYGDVFGWGEMPTLTEDRVRLVLRAWSHEQFVYLIASPEPMRCPAMDHFGLSVETPAELDAMLERAKKWRERDGRVEIVDRSIEDYGFLKLHNFYVRYRLPLMIEVQCFEWLQRVDVTRAPRSEPQASEPARATGARGEAAERVPRSEPQASEAARATGARGEAAERVPRSEPQASEAVVREGGSS